MDVMRCAVMCCGVLCRLLGVEHFYMYDTNLRHTPAEMTVSEEAELM